MRISILMSLGFGDGEATDFLAGNRDYPKREIRRGEIDQ